MLNLKKGLILTNRVSGNGKTITDIVKDKAGKVIRVQLDNSKWINADKLHNFRQPTEYDLIHGKQESYGRQPKPAESGRTDAIATGNTADARSAKTTGKRGRKSK